MPRVPLHRLRAILLLCPALLLLALTACQTYEMACRLGGHETDGEDCRGHARICENPTMDALACDLDCLEAHIDKFGSVVAMQPSVWGQARLTKYREEFEIEMYKAYPNFQAVLSASVARSDQAYAASATALSAAISGPQAYASPAPSVAVQNNNTTPLTPIPVPPATITTDAFSGFSAITRNPVPAGHQIAFGYATAGIQLEPTIWLDQKERYLNHLNQIRRNNEGDDTVDSPGYSLNLVRIPVSVLPGKCTLKGCGAEITFTLTPVISDELLPTTFRQLVINDLAQQLALPLTKVMEKPDQVEIMRKVMHVLDDNYYEKIDDLQREIATNSFNLKEMKERWQEWYSAHPVELAAAFRDAGRTARYRAQIKEIKDKLEKVMDNLQDDSGNKIPLRLMKTGKPPDMSDPAEVLQAVRDYQMNALDSAYSAPSTNRVSAFAIPLSQLLDVYATHTLIHVVDEINDTVRAHVAHGKVPYYLEVEAVLRDELEAAYRLLDSNPDLWSHCNPELVRVIRSRYQDPRSDTPGTMDALIGKFFDDVNVRKPNFVHSGTDALAWMIIVEAALLNNRLQEDMRDAAAAQGLPPVNVEQVAFFLPTRLLTREARDAFANYVKTRWPIHVFAVDPITQDQNIADTYSRRQEMQLALSLAFASGNISANKMTRYARHIEEDMDTLAINKTQVAFSHGSDTFGWRFYPRFQTPEFESNFKTIVRDQWIGGPSKNEEIRQMRLEPGMRECVAIVMMPAFVPYVKCEASSNWFRLTNPKRKEFTLATAVRLGKTVKSVQTCWPNINNADCYRDGDLARLLAKAQQLEKRLPLQDMMVQVPFEGTLGGFEMFNTGITNLAPQLRGWYGGPGILDKQDTTLFLVGDHFSVHQTRVIAGGNDVTTTELISRQIMKVTIPKGCTPNTRDIQIPATASNGQSTAKTATPTTPGGSGAPTAAATKTFKYVDVHIATPYGVTSHLEIPLVEVATTAAAAKTGLDWNQKSVTVGYLFSGNGIVPSALPNSWPPLTLKWDTTLLGTPPAAAVTADLALTFASPFSDAVTKLLQPFPTQPITVAAIDFTKLDPKTFELPIDSTMLLNSLFGIAPLPGAFGGFFGRANPPVPVMTTSVTLTLKDVNGNPLTTIKNPITVGSGLTVNWSHTPMGTPGPTVCCPPAPILPIIPAIPPLPCPGVVPMPFPPTPNPLVAPPPAMVEKK